MAEVKPAVFQSVLLGQHGDLAPEFLKEGQAHRLINVTARGGKAATRPGLVRITCPAEGRFQGSFVYRLNSTDRIAIVLSGYLWIYNVAAGTWSNPASFPTTDFAQAYFCQAGPYLVVQNGIYDPVENWPIILDGDTVVDNLEVQGNFDTVGKVSAQPNPERYRVPIGKMMAYAHGRLFIAVERIWDDGVVSGSAPGWKDGDGLVYWLAGDAKSPAVQEFMLVFAEGEYLSSYPAGQLTNELGFITAMGVFRNAASGSGQGELIIMGREGAMAYAAGAPREQWKDVNFAQSLFSTGGTDSPWSLIPVNADLVYFGRDGFRTIKFTASNESGNGSVSTVPLSPEIKPFTDLTTRAQAAYVTMAYADNYVAATAAGVSISDGSVAFRAIVPWDTAVIAASGGVEKAFTGAWAGELYHSVLSIRDVDSEDKLATVFRDEDGGPLFIGVFDKDTVEEERVARVYTPRYPFGSLVDVKRLSHAELALSEMNTDVTVRFGWRVDGDNDWHWSDTVTFSPSEYPGATGPFRIPAPRLSGSPCFNGREVASGYFFQFVIEWTGDATLDYALFRANTVGRTTGSQSFCASVTLSPSDGESLDVGDELISLGSTS